MKAIIKKEKEQTDRISIAENEIRVTTWEKVIILSHSLKKNTLEIDTKTDQEIKITFSGFIENVSPDCLEKEEIWIKTVKYKAL